MGKTHTKMPIKNQVGELLVVATPIGNLGDITLRALEALKSADIVACEDTRTSSTLLKHYGIIKKLVSYHEHNEARVSAELVERMQAGKRVALISDAGTPLLSDPGARLVKTAIEAGIRITPLPGASALLAALTIAGVSADRFLFVGFLPPKEKARATVLTSLASVPTTLVFYEAPHRLLETLEALLAAFGDRKAAVARELTKMYEECKRGLLSDLITHYKDTPPRGEIVLVVEGAAAAAMTDSEVDTALKELLLTHSVKEASAKLAAASGRSKSDIYARALKVKDAD